MSATALATGFWAREPATNPQQIAAERLGSKAGQLASITRTPMTAEARQRAADLRRECERLCTELRRAGL